MYFSQHFLKGLGCMSYLVGDEGAGEAAVIDPQLSVEEYLEEAGNAGLKIKHVLDTHLHADHVSGCRALAAATGATVHVPAKGKVRYGHVPLKEGTEIRLGNVLIRARETPGHTPEHVTFEVVDLSKGSEKPYALLTGDTLFVGSVGRPDLVGTADPQDLGNMLYESFMNVLCPSPDGVLVYPGHGAGSACGANMGQLNTTTLGYEKVVNPYLMHDSREAFVVHVTKDLPPKPGNAVNMKRINTEGPPVDPVRVEKVAQLSPQAFAEQVGDGSEVLVLDVSEPDAFAANHVPGSMNVTLGPAQFPNRVAYFLEWNLPVYLVLPDDGQLRNALMGLARVGGFDVRGFLEGGIHEWRNAGLPFETIRTVSALKLRRELEAGEARLLDVRTANEWRSGHAEGAVWVPWEALPERLHELDPEDHWVVTCGSGYRSSMGASVLKRAGFLDVGNLLGGMTAWNEASLPTIEGEAPPKQARPPTA